MSLINHAAARRLTLLAGAALLALAPAAAFAADTVTTVNPGQTTTTNQTINAPAAGDTHTVENNGTMRGSSTLLFTTIVMTGTGAGQVVINNNGRIAGRLNFSGLSGGVTFNNNTGANATTEGWHTSGITDFGAGDDAINNTANGVIASANAEVTFNFGAGEDRFDNAGVLVVGRQSGAGALTLNNLETFENSGLIVLGAAFSTAGAAYPPASDGQANDRLIAAGADFVGSGDSRIALDALLGDVSQMGCIAAGNIVADCVNLQGGSTSGETLLTVNGIDAATGPATSLVEIALIDVAGGTSHAGDFVLDPNSPGYVADGPFGGGVRVGAATYSLLYDPNTQAHRMVRLPDESLLALSVLPAAAQNLWSTVDDTSRARQAELRRARDGAAGGVWGRTTGGSSERDATTTVTLYGQSAALAPKGYEQSDAALVFGGDIAGGDADSGYAVGLSAGYVQSSIELDDAPSLDLTGFTFGLYASYRLGEVFIDASGGGYVGNLEGDVAMLPDPIDSDVTAIGGRADAGWRLPLGGGFSVAPLASVVYVSSSLSDIKLPGDKLNAIDFGNGKSLRGGLGGEAAFEADLGGVMLDLSLTGRAWQEFEGETVSQVQGRGSSLDLTDAFSGTFGEIAASADISGFDGALSGFVGVVGRFGDDYSSASAQFGVRFNW
jgi:outer membrane autotransporter protein